MKKKKDFVFNDSSTEHVIVMKKRNYWWLLLFLLLLLPLILLIRLQKDVVSKTINSENSEILQGTFVKFSFVDRDLFSLRTKKFMSIDTIKLQDTTNSMGIVVFKNVSYSLYAKLFHSQDLAFVSATNRCFMGDSLKPKFFDLKDNEETTLKLPERTYDLDFKVIDVDDNEPLPEAKVEYTDIAGNKQEAVSDAHGMVVFKKIAFCSDVILVGSKYGYANDTIADGVITLTEGLENRTLKLKPIKSMVSFFIADLYSKQPLPNAKAMLIIEKDTVKISTNTNGVGKGAFDDVHIISKMHIEASRVFYNDTSTGVYVVEKFVKMTDKERTIYMRPKTQSLEFKNIDGSTGAVLAGVENQIIINGANKGTEISNASGTFIIAGVLPTDKISIIATKHNYKTNNTKVSNRISTELDTQDKKTIPLTVNPPPPPPPPPPPTPPDNIKPPPPNVVIRPCDAPQKSGGNGTTINVHSLGTSSQFTITWDMLSLPDRITVYCGTDAYSGSIYDSQIAVAGVGSRTLTCNSGYVTVKIVGGGFLTAWSYSIKCH